MNQFVNQTSIISVSEDENGNVMAWPNNEKVRYKYFFARQKYSYKRLLALGEDGEQYVDSFRCNSFQYYRFPTETTDVIHLTLVRSI